MAQKKTRSKAGSKGKKRARGSGEAERYQKALDGLERAIKALHKGEAEKAKEGLERIRDDHPEEKELLDRVQTYLKICEQRLAPQRRPKSAEELTTYGVLYHNEGDFQQAIKYLSKALELEPTSAHIHYCLAAAHAQAGNAAAAARHLKDAIEADPTNRIHARTDADFAQVRAASEVASVLGAA